MKRKWLVLVGCVVCLLTGCGDPNDIGTIDVKRIEARVESTVTEESSEPVMESSVVEEVEEESSEEIIEESKEVSITISATGDVTLGNYWGQGYAGTFEEMWDQQQNPAYFFENVVDIFNDDDMTVINLEGPLTTATARREGQTYCIKGDPEYVQALTNGGVDAAGMANNHRMDYFEAGTEETVDTLTAEGIPYAYDDKVGIYETKGIQIGFVSVNVVGYGKAVEKFVENGITTLKNQGVDLILCLCHWGVERDNFPQAYQQTLGRMCIDLGADLVIGHHPHVLQGIEEYQGKYIAYSLGNFCFGANKNPADKDCIIFQQTFTFEEGVKKDETTARIIPCSISSESGRNDYKPTPAEGDKADKILKRMTEYSAKYKITFDENGTIIHE